MVRYTVFILISASIFTSCGTSGRLAPYPESEAGDAAAAPVPLFKAALGPFERRVSTASDSAQAYMKQGFQMMYAFAASEAPASFREAQKHDENCAMCYWGEAWSLGPYLNSGMQPSNTPAAFEAINKARALAEKNATPAEKALIDAMQVRYAETHDADERKRLDTLYAHAMAGAYKQFPDDLDIGTLYAESLMLLEPRRGTWDIDDPDVRAIHGVLEEVLALDIRHPGACHLYIHATESTTKPGKAEACAEFLGSAIPGASHINHMPSHTYNRIGRWGDAVRANIQAWHSDLKAEIDEGFAIYPAHNLHMLLFAASMDGQGAQAIQAGKDFAKIVEDGQFYRVLTLLRFGRFDEILALDNPPELQIFRGLWDFGKGYAHLHMGNHEEARLLLARVETAAAETPADQTFRGHSASDLLGVVGGILKGEMLLQQGRGHLAIEVLQRAVEIEDSLRYDEPEPLNFSARHWLGAAYLDLHMPAEAEAVYRAELEDHPNNGWSLFGLTRALEAQDKVAEASDTRKAFEKAWARSDTWIQGSRF